MDIAYKNAKGNTECVVFIQSVLHAPHTLAWAGGEKITRLKPGEKDPIPEGTAIATFVHGVYPQMGGGHAAIYLYHDKQGLHVLDQWDKKGKVTDRIIYWGHGGLNDLVDDPNAFSVILW